MLKKLKQINEKVAVSITNFVGNMFCAYGFAGLALLPLAFPILYAVCLYISSSFLQLVLLPIIMVGQNVIGNNTQMVIDKINSMVSTELLDISDALTRIESIQENQSKLITEQNLVLEQQTELLIEVRNLHAELHSFLKKETVDPVENCWEEA